MMRDTINEVSPMLASKNPTPMAMDGRAATGKTGYRFDPTEVELLQDYLSRYAVGLSPPVAIPVRDVYGTPPWDLPPGLEGHDGSFFCFTRRFRCSENGTRTKRAVCSTGTWFGNRTWEVVDGGGRVVGYKTLLSFRRDKKVNTGWVMNEFRLAAGAAGDDGANSSNTKFQDLVLCKIKNRKKNEGPACEKQKMKMIEHGHVATHETGECSGAAFGDVNGGAVDAVPVGFLRSPAPVLAPDHQLQQMAILADDHGDDDTALDDIIVEDVGVTPSTLVGADAVAATAPLEAPLAPMASSNERTSCKRPWDGGDDDDQIWLTMEELMDVGNDQIWFTMEELMGDGGNKNGGADQQGHVADQSTGVNGSTYGGADQQGHAADQSTGVNGSTSTGSLHRTVLKHPRLHVEEEELQQPAGSVEELELIPACPGVPFCGSDGHDWGLLGKGWRGFPVQGDGTAPEMGARPGKSMDRQHTATTVYARASLGPVM